MCVFLWFILSFFPYCLFVSNSQVIGCEDRLRNDLYCVGWGVKLYSIQFSGYAIETCMFVRMWQTYQEAVDSAVPSEREYVTSKCLIGLYIPLLLNTGFGFANNSQNIYVLDKIAGEKPGICRFSVCANDGNKTKMLTPRPRPIKQQQDYITKNSSVATRIFVIKK